MNALDRSEAAVNLAAAKLDDIHRRLLEGSADRQAAREAELQNATQQLVRETSDDWDHGMLEGHVVGEVDVDGSDSRLSGTQLPTKVRLSKLEREIDKALNQALGRTDKARAVFDWLYRAWGLLCASVLCWLAGVPLVLVGNQPIQDGSAEAALPAPAQEVSQVAQDRSSLHASVAQGQKQGQAPTAIGHFQSPQAGNAR